MDETLRANYRLTFLQSEMGLAVLTDILQTCHFGCTLNPENQVQVTEYNVGVVILHKLGILESDTMNQVVNALSGVQTQTTNQEEERSDPLEDFR